MTNPNQEGDKLDTKLKIADIKMRLASLKPDEAKAKATLEEIQLEIEENRTNLRDLEQCLAVSGRFILDSQGRPAPLLPGEEPVIPEGRGVSPE